LIVFEKLNQVSEPRLSTRAYLSSTSLGLLKDGTKGCESATTTWRCCLRRRMCFEWTRWYGHGI